MNQTGDRIKETTTTTGSAGAYALAGAVGGFQSFAAGVGVGNECYFIVTDSASWEVCFGSLTSASTLTRLSVEASSNAGAAVVWGAGPKTIACTLTARGVALPGVDWRRVPRTLDLGSAAFCRSDQIPVNLHPQQVGANYQLVPDDHGAILYATAGPVFCPLASFLSSGWAVPVVNYGTGNVYLTASGTDTIDGGTQVLVLPGVTRWVVWYDAASFRTF